MKISRIGEFGLIRRIRHHFTHHVLHTTPEFIGIGDDAAVIRISAKKYLLWTTDVLIEGIHFLPLSRLSFLHSTFNIRHSTAFMLGWKSLAINLSDIAAMGGVPKYALVTLGLRGNEDVKFIDDLYRGMTACSGAIYRTCSGRVYSAVKILGGDTSKSPVLMINVSILGEVEKENLILRKGARPGDIICVTGFCGISASGFAILRSGSIHRAHCSGRAHSACSGRIHPTLSRYLILRHLMPSPRIKEARIIAENGFATSMIDSSDGLLASVNFICQESGVGARIYKNKIPVSPQLKKCSGRVHSAIQKFALTGGEDYELVFTVPPKRLDEVTKKIPKLTGTQITQVGEITKSKRIYLIDAKGRKKTVNKIGYEHF